MRELIVDEAGRRVADNSGSVIGMGGLLNVLWVDAGSQNLRYYPSHFPNDSYEYGVSFESILPKGIGIDSGSIIILTNTTVPAPAADLASGPVAVRGRTVYANVSGGGSGTDYQLRWTADGSDGSIHSVTSFLLCEH